ncbi:MAG: T9SS type A sorting domain-containing protein, partial [Bacteroidetes bacterium]|nr:T9SS type A sorting domain-containing protein [Bacteroidota bacterium]
IATSTGLYSTSVLNGTSTVWAQEGSTAIGNVVSVMVKSRDSDGLVVVGTHGAGIYSANNDNTTTPTTQASNITFSNILTTSATISWTNGNGSNRAVFVKQGNSGTAAPVDNTTYTANTSFGSGTQIGATGWYNVYNGTSTSVGITNFAHGTEYRVMVVEYNGSAGGEDYNTNFATNNPNNFLTTISTPTLSSPLNAATGQALNVNLSWSSVSGADKYTLEVNTDNTFPGSTAVAVSGQPQSGTSKAPGGLSDNTTYYWRVTASNSSNGATSPVSSTFNFTTTQQSVSGILPTDNSFGIPLSPTLQWPAGPTGTDTYRLEVNTDNGFGSSTSVFDNATLTTNSKALSGLSNNTKYYWRVTAQSNLAKVSASVINSFTTKLSTSTLTSPTNNSTDVSLIPTLSWSDVLGTDKYRLEVNTTSDFTGTVVYDQDTLNNSSKQIGGLTDNTKYYWRVTALNNTGNSSDTSSTFNFTVSQTVLTSASNGATAVSTSPTLSWNKTSGANKYRLEVNTKSDFTGTVIFDNATITDTLQAISGLSNNTIYYWRVTASSNTLTKTTTSVVYNFTTKLSTPTLTSPVNNATDLILAPTLSWSSISGADKYRLEVNTKLDFTGTVVYDQDTVSTSTKQIGGLTDNTKYYWRVTALNNSGNSSDTSSTFNFTTETATGIETLNNIIPKGYSLSQNYPNPFNPSTIIRYGLPSESFVTIKIYNLLGQEINKLVHKIESAGYHEITFNSKKLASGIYFYRIIAKSVDGKKDFITTKKLILMK